MNKKIVKEKFSFEFCEYGPKFATLHFAPVSWFSHQKQEGEKEMIHSKPVFINFFKVDDSIHFAFCIKLKIIKQF